MEKIYEAIKLNVIVLLLLNLTILRLGPFCSRAVMNSLPSLITHWLDAGPVGSFRLRSSSPSFYCFSCAQNYKNADAVYSSIDYSVLERRGLRARTDV